MKNYFRLFAVAFILNLILGAIFIIFNDSIIERSDIAILVGIGSTILSSIAFGFACVFISIYKGYKIIKLRNQKS